MVTSWLFHVISPGYHPCPPLCSLFWYLPTFGTFVAKIDVSNLGATSKQLTNRPVYITKSHDLWLVAQVICWSMSIRMLQACSPLDSSTKGNTGWWWLEPWNFMTFHSVGNVIIPSDELIFFRWVGIPPTRPDIVFLKNKTILEPCWILNKISKYVYQYIYIY